MKKIFFIGIISIFVLFFGFPLLVNASETTFSVSPVLPENQIDQSKSYFTLLMTQSEEQDIHITLTNNSAETMTIQAEVGPATTNDNGYVEYLNREINLDTTLKYNLSELAEYSKEVEIEANASVDYTIHLKMPDEPISGVIAGGVTFKQKEEEKSIDSSDTQNGITLENRIEYLEAILIQQSTDVPNADLVINNVGATQVNSRNVIQANLQNPIATYINNVESTVKVYKYDEDEVLFTQHTEGQQIAPNSNFNYTLYLDDNTSFQAGKYIWEQVVSSDENEWTFKEDFTITREEANQLNETDVTVEKEEPNYLMIGLCLLCSLLIVILLIVLIQNKRLASKEKSNKIKKKKKK